MKSGIYRLACWLLGIGGEQPVRADREKAGAAVGHAPHIQSEMEQETDVSDRKT